MASIQAPTTAWMAYSDATRLPPAQLYVGPFRQSEPSYTTLSAVKQPDQTLTQALEPIIHSAFLSAYFSFDRAFGDEDSYSLFVPLQDSIIEGLVNVHENANLGFSYKDRKFKTESRTRIDQILEQHMVPVKIQPKQIEYRNTRVSTLRGNIIINEKGEINDGVSTILQFIDLPRCTIFLISKEIV
jgi:uncharacterized surface protein with fasciclin (FAS1) repeats